MKFSIIPAKDGGRRERVGDLESQGVSWVRFGDRLLVYAADAKRRVARGTLGGIEPTGDIRKGNMHLVVQKGRTFQQEHPKARVILDKGRYLIVDMAPKQARELAGRPDPCFHIENLRENSVVFDEIEVARQTPSAELVLVVDGLSQASFEAALAHLVSFPTRLSTTSTYMSAAEWARDRLISLGLSATIRPVTVGSAASSNVVAVKPGTAAAPGQVLVVAHLDSINTAGGPTAPAPGADDNASGAAGLLTLAEAMAGYDFAHDLVFVLFGGEEQGLHGSTQYVAGLDAAERGRIRAVVNMDMIGHVNTTPEKVLLEGAAVSQGVIDGLAAAAGQFTTIGVQTSLSPFASDHVPFINAGVPAVLTIEGADGANDQIHTAGDVLSRVEPAFAMQILRMSAGYLAATAEVAASIAVPGPGPYVVPPSSPALQPAVGAGGCGCGGTPGLSADEAQAQNLLKLHYQALFAQYARLHQAGRMSTEDSANWRAARAAYERLAGGGERQPYLPA